MSVLTEALYEQLPALTPKQEEGLRREYTHRLGPDRDPLAGGGRKLLMFSDSRQNAAFMASYLQDHCREYLVRELAWEALSKAAKPLNLIDWADAIIQVIAERKLHVPYLEDRDMAELSDDTPFRGSYRTNASEKQNILMRSLLSELTGTQPLVLESLGLIEVHIPLDSLLSRESAEIFVTGLPWLDPGVTCGDMRDLLDRFARLLRRQYILTCPENVQRPGFSDTQPYLVLERTQELGDYCRGLLSAAGHPTMLEELIRRWIVAIRCKEPSIEEVRDFIIKLWGFFLLDGGANLFKKETFGEAIGLALRHDILEVAIPSRLWKCDRCGTPSVTRLRHICPEPGCRGRLVAVAPEEYPAVRPEQHMFVNRFVHGRRAELRCEEHTAQLSANLGQEILSWFSVNRSIELAELAR